MDDDFKKLEKCGKNTVDDLIKWMKDAKIVDGIKVTEQKVRDLLCKESDQKKVQLENFKKVLTEIAAEQKKNIEDFSKYLCEAAPKFLDALKAGASAFKDTLNKK